MKRVVFYLVVLTLISVYAASAGSISVVPGLRVGLYAVTDYPGPGGQGFFDIGGKCDVVFEMIPFKGYLAMTPTLDYGLNLELPSVFLAGISAKARYPHRRFIPYAYFGGVFYTEGTNESASGAFATRFGDGKGVLATVGGGIDVRFGSRFAVNAEFMTLDFGTFIGGLGGVDLFL